MLNPEAAIFAALRIEPGLTVTGLARRVPFSRGVIFEVLYAAEQGGHVTAVQHDLQLGDTGRAVRYSLAQEAQP